MNGRERFLDALHGHNHSGRPPAWLMRQAGRYLPEYRALKEKHSFRTLVQTPDLATEVTLQPLRRFPKLDAAILFSDILVIPEALGVPYRFREEGGIELERTIRSAAEAATLRPDHIGEKLQYVGDALRSVRSELDGSQALLGFCGAPWTLALYLVEGGSPGEGHHLRRWLYEEPDSARALLRTVAAACTEYARLLEAAGADALQIFDSWAGLCPAPLYEELCLTLLEPLLEAVSLPVLLFSRGAGNRLRAQQALGTRALALDWQTPLRESRELLGPDTTLQGNLDPLLLTTSPETVEAHTRALLDSLPGDPAWILNTGHGVTPQTRIDCVHALLDCLDR